MLLRRTVSSVRLIFEMPVATSANLAVLSACTTNTIAIGQPRKWRMQELRGIGIRWRRLIRRLLRRRRSRKRLSRREDHQESDRGLTRSSKRPLRLLRRHRLPRGLVEVSILVILCPVNHLLSRPGLVASSKSLPVQATSSAGSSIGPGTRAWEEKRKTVSVETEARHVLEDNAGVPMSSNGIVRSLALIKAQIDENTTEIESALLRRQVLLDLADGLNKQLQKMPASERKL
jgi:hypothetical protein